LNNLNAKTFGGEAAATYDVLESVRFTMGYSYLGERLSLDPGHVDLFSGTIDRNDPKHQFFFRGSADLPHNIEWDSSLRFISKLPSPVVPSYFEVDARLGWSPTATTEFSLNGRNLLHAHHPEFGPASPTREEIERNIYGRIALRF
jgi:iron complex outermembrane receptor protein